jgi:stalled ribosome rescue protein Dom34
MLRKTKGSVSLRLSKTDYSKLNRLRGPQADTSCVTSVINMKTAKKLGVWMDHAHAHLMEFTTGTMEAKIIESKFTPEVRQLSLHKGEDLMHKKERQQKEYYKTLGKTIKKYDEAVLFGPTDAKVELFNFLMQGHRLRKTKIKVEHTDKMTENQ